MSWPAKETALAEARRRLGQDWFARGAATLASLRPAAGPPGGPAPDRLAARRADFVRILYQVRWEAEAVPGPTAWAYFDVGMGWSGPEAHAGDFRALVRTWAAELQAAGRGRGRRP
jgi:hypothetical protein